MHIKHTSTTHNTNNNFKGYLETVIDSFKGYLETDHQTKTKTKNKLKPDINLLVVDLLSQPKYCYIKYITYTHVKGKKLKPKLKS